MLGTRYYRVVLLVATLAFGTCSSPSPPRTIPSAPLTLAGTEYLAPLIRAEVLAFRDRYPDADSIRILATGSAEGMEMLVNGEVAMSLLLRDLTDLEADAAVKRAGLQAYPIAWDAIAVIVNPASPIEQLSRTELGQVYGGETQSWAPLGWKQGGTIIALTVGPRWGLYGYLQQTLLDGGAYAPGIYAPPTEAEAVEVVATRTNAIACVSRFYAEEAASRVRILRISQVAGLPYIPLSRETLLTRTYPLLRPVYIAASANPPATAANLVTFMSGMDGQRIVARHGYAPAAVPIEIIRTAEEAP